MNIILFVIMLITSFIVVRVGAIAFQLTGLEWSLAKFQSLSCFTGTGFTTKEAELIRRGTEAYPNPQADAPIETGDRLLCFGRLDRMRAEFKSSPVQDSMTTSSSPDSASG